MTQQPLRILCLGDSLTGGYTELGLKHHPYSDALVRKLRAAFPDLEVEVVVDGLDGDMTNNFHGRLSTEFRKTRRLRPFDWTIVLGGTNDLACGHGPKHIFDNLERTWSNAITRKSKVLALTVPELGRTAMSPAMSNLAIRRDTLNLLIKLHKYKNFHSFDFKSAFSYTAMSPDDRQRYWDDGLHFTAAGYDLMGERIGAALADILYREAEAKELAQDGMVHPEARPVRRRRKFKDDEANFEEEAGPPTELQRGYVVVRWTDLD